MVSFATRAVKAYSRLVIKKDPTSSAQLVKHFRRALSSPLPPLLPRTVTRHSFQGNGIQGEWLRVKNPSMAVLYLHGGGYIEIGRASCRERVWVVMGGGCCYKQHSAG